MIEDTVRQIVAVCKARIPAATEVDITNRILLALQHVLKPDDNPEASLAQIKRRLGVADSAVYEEEARLSMDSSEPPEWVVVLDFRALPHGARHWIRVKIGPSPEPLGTIETRSVPWWFCSPEPYCDDAWGPAREMLVHERTLDEPQCSEILDILASSTLGDLQSVREDRRVIDGCPCELMAARREPRQQIRASFNLASIQRTALRNQPAVRLTRTLMALRDKIRRD